MWPVGKAVLIQSVVSWHTEQSLVAMRGSELLTWSAGRSCSGVPLPT